MKKNWMWAVPACVAGVLLTILLLLLVLFLIELTYKRNCYLTHNYPDRVTAVEVGNEMCNKEGYSVLDLSVFTNLKSITIGDNSFSSIRELNVTGLTQLQTIRIGSNSLVSVNGLKLIGLKSLEMITIGSRSFTHPGSETWPFRWCGDGSRSLSVKDCPLLKEVVFDSGSFMDYGTLSIESTPWLRSLSFGRSSFAWSSLKLASTSSC